MDFTSIPTATLFAMMLALGMELRGEDFARLLGYPRAVVFGITGQLILLPAIAFALVGVLPLTAASAVGLMIIAACPGGATSNVFTRYAQGDVALSISLTAFSSVLAPLTVPLIIGLAVFLILGNTTTITVSATEMMVTLVLTTALPVMLGVLCLRYRPRMASRCRGPLLALATAVLILLIIGLAINTGRTHADLGGMFTRSLLAVLLLMGSLAGLTLLGARLLRLPAVQGRTLVLELGIQNINLALVIALNFLNEPQYLGPALVYLPVMLLFSAIVIASSRHVGLVTRASS